MAANESCAGCGSEPAEGQTHPMVAVLNVADLAPDREPLGKEDPWVAVPVCKPCHVEPSRQSPKIKGHFYERGAMRTALRLAGSSTIGG